eukprot:TRINITY_DN30527_c0_g1_i1.p1 TRINITY_DN30527_c0_g1~~TRINITY_DN30527_c0_g1_i1.p1  ORF type:complete len:1100 (-),score=199.46 TRINITY_DN30527_c0_g1_i1:245-3544(-)
MVLFEMGPSAGDIGAAHDDLPASGVIIAIACLIGILLAAVDDSGASQGTGPISHLGGCADSAYALLADGALLVEGGGLGLIEPLREVFAKRPDGLLGFDGLVASIRSLLAAFCLGRSPRAAAVQAQDGVPSSLTHEKIRMSLTVELSCYAGYIYLFVVGVIREYTIRILSKVSSNPVYKEYVTRERWSTGWVDFYLNHCYSDVKECFQRPICSAPDACVNVVKRVRPGGKLFGPLYKFHLTDEWKRCVNLSSYNYLGFGGIDEFCTPSARKCALEIGFSSGGTRIEGGTLTVHRELEAEVARFLGKDDALVLGMGFATNSTVLPALFEAQAGGTGILVLSDALNHRSIVEGVRLSGASVRAFGHNDMSGLEEQLRKAVVEGQPGGKPWRKIFIAVEGIYSMEGDFCRLREIVTLKNRYKAYLFLDEAHSIGAVGATGRGVTELLGVPTDQVDIMMGTFTKSFGSSGGYIAASSEVVDSLRKNSPGIIFASAMSPPLAAQALAAFRVIAGIEGGNTGAQKLKAIRDNSNFFRRRLDEEGFKTLGDVDSPVIPTMIHHPQKMKWFSQQCLERGIAVVVVGYPAVPLLYERVRFCISASHTETQLAEVATEIADIGRRMGLLFDRGLKPSERVARQRREAEYAKWLRTAPLERHGEAAIAAQAAAWEPEPLVAVGAQTVSLVATPAFASATLQAVKDVQQRTPRDCRLFDPLGYVTRMPAAATLAIEQTMDTYGFGACGPRGFYGTTKPHLELEDAISRFLGVESTVVYSFGAVTASSVLPALVQPGDRVLVDSEAHLGIRAGLRLCKAEITWIPHGDVIAIESALSAVKEGKGRKKSSQHELREGRIVIVLEGISQRTGRLAPLVEVLALKERYGALLVLDETLSFGALGHHGRGLCEHLSVDPARVDALIGSLEHTVASVGGFCSGRFRIVEHQRLAGAGYCYSASSPPCSSMQAVAILEDMASLAGVERQERLRGRTLELHKALQEAVAEAEGAPLELVSSCVSYVQHLRWVCVGQPREAVDELLAIAQNCAAASDSDGVRAQVCVPGACGAEGAFDDRLAAPPSSMPTLRFCASAEQTSTDITAIVSALRTALRVRKS